MHDAISSSHTPTIIIKTCVTYIYTPTHICPHSHVINTYTRTPTLTQIHTKRGTRHNVEVHSMLIHGDFEHILAFYQGCAIVAHLPNMCVRHEGTHAPPPLFGVATISRLL